jgi:tryptophan-rich sensory protein
LAIVVGIPFFVVSTSAPLLQKWFASTGHPSSDDPYFLYGASNLGSLLSLICYPFLIEPNIILPHQAWVWVVLYVILGGLILACAYLVFKTPGAFDAKTTGANVDLPPEPPIPPPPAPPPGEASTAVKSGPAHGALPLRGIQRKKAPKTFSGKAPVHAETSPDIAKPRTDEVTLWRRIRWVMLSAVPVSLMLAVTSYVSIDLSPFPLLWVIPLALYLLTFIMVFMKIPVPWTTIPHKVVLFVQPIGVALLAYPLIGRIHDPVRATIFCMLGFFVTTLMCHGELARDRPSTKYLTEYFLWISVGGMLGGLFNAMFAPLLFVGVVEFPLAIILSCFMRPKERDAGWTEELLCQAFPGMDTYFREQGDQLAVARGKPAPHSLYLFGAIMDVVLGLALFGIAILCFNFFTQERVINILKFIGFGPKTQAGLQAGLFLFTIGIPMVFCFLFASRPVRFGLAVMGLILVHLVIYNQDNRDVVAANRTYFGVLRVAREGHSEESRPSMERILSDPEIEKSGTVKVPPSEVGEFYYLMHGTTYHGRNYHEPKELQRLATTYYHRKGPVGAIMERFNWAPGPQNTFWADARLPAAMVGLGATPLGVGSMPLEQIANAYSEPPIATIGLGTGTMASYGRPFQHVVFYEIDDAVRNFSLPPDGSEAKTYFNYLKGAKERGAGVEVIMGDAALSMRLEDPKLTKHYPKRQGYYKAIVVDAFSSDAIPVHLITKEAIQLYLDKLAPDGVILVHTSNRHLDLPRPVTDIAKDLKLDWRVGKDGGRRGGRGEEGTPYLGHFGSEYVMLAHKDGVLQDLYKLPKFRNDPSPMEGSIIQWSKPSAQGDRIWTKDYSDIVSILREGNLSVILAIVVGVPLGILGLLIFAWFLTQGNTGKR